MGVTLHIEELVLHGFDPRDRHSVADALRGELAALLAARAPSASAELGRVDAGSIDLDHVRSPRAGQAIAGAVHREVTR